MTRARARFATARAFALGLPLVLIGGALGFQYLGGLYPCEMCWWQRYPHIAAIVLAALAYVVAVPLRAPLVVLAAFAILTSGGIGVYHAGVEYHWWQGVTACTSTVTGPITLDAILHAPVVRCDVPQWTFAHVSLAGFNAILSIAGGVGILAAMRGAAA